MGLGSIAQRAIDEYKSKVQIKMREEFDKETMKIDDDNSESLNKLPIQGEKLEETSELRDSSEVLNNTTSESLSNNAEPTDNVESIPKVAVQEEKILPKGMIIDVEEKNNELLERNKTFSENVETSATKQQFAKNPWERCKYYKKTGDMDYCQQFMSLCKKDNCPPKIMRKADDFGMMNKYLKGKTAVRMDKREPSPAQKSSMIEDI